MKYHAAVPAAGVAAAVGVADAAGAALAAAVVDFSVCGALAVVSTKVAELVAVFGEVAAVVVESAAAVGESAAVVVAVLELGALTPEEARGAPDDCLVEARLRAGPAVPVAPVDFEGVPASLAELPFDTEPDDSRSGAAAATP
ncbi:hypothetical protein [Mycolicibacterium helvum]|uniref:hypothetical protein n=1 Tax=Mycolicibacterium helvum TaxID=1534349 RepID=UPI0013D85EF9|nr:hypothetical protein [Mycolicibacterium helvum]